MSLTLGSAHLIRYGYEEIVHMLLSDPRVLPKSNSLKKACVRGHRKVVKLILDHSHDDSKLYFSPTLLMAIVTYNIIQKTAFNGDFDIVIDLLIHQVRVTLAAEAAHADSPARPIINTSYTYDMIVTSPFYTQLKDDPTLTPQTKHQIIFNTAWTIALGNLRTARISDPLSIPDMYEFPSSFYSKVYEFLTRENK